MDSQKVKLSTGAELEYEKKGAGDPVIIIHGFLGTARTEMGKIIDWLADTYTVYAPTLRGYGESQPKHRRFPSDFYQIDTDDVIAFMDTLEIEKTHFLGFSDGGEIGLLIGSEHPEKFLSIIVWGAVGFLGPVVKKEVRKYYPADWVTEEVMSRHGITDPNPIVKEWMEAILSIVEAGGDISLHLAKRISPPLLLMLGEKDYLNPPEYARKFLKKAGHGSLEMFTCGHAIHDEDWEGFTASIRRFLSSLIDRPL